MVRVKLNHMLTGERAEPRVRTSDLTTLTVVDDYQSTRHGDIMPNYEIATNVAIPETSTNRNTDRLKTILAMEIGDSVFIENKYTAASYARAMKDKAGFSQVTRPWTEGEGKTAKEGYRVWRVAPKTEEDAD